MPKSRNPGNPAERSKSLENKFKNDEKVPIFWGAYSFLLWIRNRVPNFGLIGSSIGLNPSQNPGGGGSSAPKGPFSVTSSY